MVKDRDQHILTLRIACGVLAPNKLTVHNPPDLRIGSTRPWWEVPAASVYSFAFYIFQQLNAWPKNGESGLSGKNSCVVSLSDPGLPGLFECRGQEKTDRVRVVYEIPGRGYQSKSVSVINRDNWVVRLDLVANEDP